MCYGLWGCNSIGRLHAGPVGRVRRLKHPFLLHCNKSQQHLFNHCLCVHGCGFYIRPWLHEYINQHISFHSFISYLCKRVSLLTPVFYQGYSTAPGPDYWCFSVPPDHSLHPPGPRSKIITDMNNRFFFKQWNCLRCPDMNLRVVYSQYHCPDPWSRCRLYLVYIDVKSALCCRQITQVATVCTFDQGPTSCIVNYF